MQSADKKLGFTLVEMIIVIGIIGVLTTIVVASTAVSRSKARDTKRLGDIKEIQLALALYNDVHRGYPSTLNDLLTERFLSELPTDPTGGEYEYALASGRYCLGAHLEDLTTNPGDNANCSTGGTANYTTVPPVN